MPVEKDTLLASTRRMLNRHAPPVPGSGNNVVGLSLTLEPNQGRLAEGGLRVHGHYKQSGEDLPLVSIICAVFNGREHLEGAIESILQQDYDNVELIVIDGGSTDGTLQVVQDQEDCIDYYVSEKDSGIADAWNKGLACASGDIIGFLNADDYYSVNTITTVVEIAKDHLNELFISYGDTQMLDGSACRRYLKGSFDPGRLHYGFGFMHTTCFATRATYNKIGLFNTMVRIAIDTDWLVRSVVAGVRFEYAGNLTYMREGGVSDTLEWTAFQEYLEVLKKYGIKKVQIARYTFLGKLAFRKVFGKRHVADLRMQAIYTIIFMLNLGYNWLPFFSVKKKFIALAGITIGKCSYVHTPVRFFSKGRVDIGDHSTVNPGCYLDNRGPIRIGNNVSIARDTKIYTAGHDIDEPCFRRTERSVVIGDDVCIFSHALILPGVTIGKGAVVYPGSVVTKDVEPYSIVGGNPAVHIRYRSSDLRYEIDYKYLFAH
mgnify:CR=1 FL=1